jgi:hypothetical protein
MGLIVGALARFLYCKKGNKKKYAAEFFGTFRQVLDWCGSGGLGAA